jgi:guanylate kinase
MNQKAEQVLEKLLEWKFFANNYYELSESDQEELKRDIEDALE